MNNHIDLIDEELKKIASVQEIDLPYQYEKMVKSRIDQCMGRRNKMRFKMSKVAVAALTLVLVFAGAGGVYAAGNFVYQRMSQISDEEKEEYVSELLQSDADRDSCSREFTQEERDRMIELQNAYEQGLYPEDSLIRIETKNEIVPDRVCFLASESCFYIPDHLTDEDMLELIDFYYIRDYSLAESTDQEEEQWVDEPVSEEDAITIAREKIQHVFETDLSDAEVSPNYNQGEKESGAFSEYHVCFFCDGMEYMAAVDLQNGNCYDIQKSVTEKETYVDADTDSVDISELYTDAEKIANKYVEKDMDWNQVVASYTESSDETIVKGIVRYQFYCDDLEVIVNYSCSLNDFYLVRSLETPEEIEAFDASLCEQRDGNKLVEVEIKK